MRTHEIGIFLAVGLALYSVPSLQSRAYCCPEMVVERFVAPAYSEIARRREVQGEVEAKLHIVGSGEVQSVEIVSGHRLLVDRVSSAVSEWKFCPISEPRELVVTVTFRLDGEPRDVNLSTRIVAMLPNSIEVVTNPPKVYTVDAVTKD